MLQNITSHSCEGLLPEEQALLSVMLEPNTDTAQASCAGEAVQQKVTSVQTFSSELQEAPKQAETGT